MVSWNSKSSCISKIYIICTLGEKGLPVTGKACFVLDFHPRVRSLRLFPAAHAHATDTLELVHRELFFSLKWGLMVFFIYFVELSTYQTCKYIIVHVQSTQQNSFMIMMN